MVAEKREGARASHSVTARLVFLKLIAQPAATWVLATRVFHLAPGLTQAAVLLAALPTGTSPFMVADYYGREAVITARIVLITTIASLATVTLYLAWAARQ